VITIELNGKKVEAQDEKEAKKMLAKLARQEKKEAQERDAKYKIAYLRAESNGYTMPRGWTFHTALCQHVPFEYKPDWSMTGTPKPEITWHGEHGDATSDHYGYTLWGVVSNGAGFPLCCFLTEHGKSPTESMECYALGIEGDTVAFAPLHGVLPTEFNASRHNEAQ
jgi:hypothetical protein